MVIGLADDFTTIVNIYAVLLRLACNPTTAEVIGSGLGARLSRRRQGFYAYSLVIGIAGHP